MAWTNAELLSAFENACFQLAHAPMKKAAMKRFAELEQRMANCMCISDEDLEKIRSGEI